MSDSAGRRHQTPKSTVTVISAALGILEINQILSSVYYNSNRHVRWQKLSFRLVGNGRRDKKPWLRVSRRKSLTLSQGRIGSSRMTIVQFGILWSAVSVAWSWASSLFRPQSGKISVLNLEKLSWQWNPNKDVLLQFISSPKPPLEKPGLSLRNPAIGVYCKGTALSWKWRRKYFGSECVSKRDREGHEAV